MTEVAIVDDYVDDEEKATQLIGKLDMVYVIEKKSIFDDIMQPFPITLGKAVSKKEREEMELRNPRLTYGEIEFETLGTVFEKIKKIYGKPNVGSSGPDGMLQAHGGIFYDLGSGTGKGVIGAAVLYNFDICYGIELLEGLYTVSQDAVNSYNTRGVPKLGRENNTRTYSVRLV